MIYIIDASSWIVFNQYYPRHIFGVLWTRMERLVKNDQIQSPIQVRAEIKTYKDDLYDLVRKNKNMFKENKPDTIELVDTIISENPFLLDFDPPENADPFIIALALNISKIGMDDPIIVTEENPAGRWSIPFVAKQYNLKSIKLLELFDQQKWHFNKE